MPTIAKLAALQGYAAGANLQFTPVTATSGINAVTQTSGTGTVNLSGQMAAVKPTQGTRVSFKPVDVNNNGSLDLGEGMMMIFDIADGMDTSTLRVGSAAVGHDAEQQHRHAESVRAADAHPRRDSFRARARRSPPRTTSSSRSRAFRGTGSVKRMMLGTT